MAITFPVNHPASPGFRSVTMIPVPVSGRSRSPFTGEQQVQVHQGQWWEAIVELPRMTRAQGQAWIAFLVQLNGLEGTFLLTPPGQGTPLGVATGTPQVNGGSQTGNTLATKGWTTGVTDIMKAGDYFQLGSGSSAKLHMNLTDQDSDGSGNATLDIWPNLRSSPNDSDTIVVSDPVGVFVLANNDESNWSIDAAIHYGISFRCREDL